MIELLRNVQSVMQQLESRVRTEVRALRSDVTTVRAVNEAEHALTRKELNEQFNALRRAVMEYHASAIGHGAMITELEERLARVEQRLKVPPKGSH